jgi:hypothetical protein
MSLDPLPDIPTVRDLSPPYPDYPYYEGTDGPAFVPDAKGYSRVNAWWLAEASLLAYGGRELADPLLQRPTLLQRDEVQIESVPGPQDNGVLLLSSEQFVIAAFRGTCVLGLQSPAVFLRSVEPHLTDLVTDIRFRPAPFDPGKVHEGFLAAFGEVEACLRDRLGSLSGRPVWFTGHSLGAALATLAAARFGAFQGLYTFGSPRVGDEDFAASFAGQPCFRFVHHNDIVTRIPPPRVSLLPGSSTYAHVGALVYIDQDGTVRQDLAPEDLTDVLAGSVNIQDVISSFLTSAQDLVQILTHPQPVGPPAEVRVVRDAVTDHAPLYYAGYLKKDLERQG